MEDLKKRFENNYLLGCIKYLGRYELYLMPIAYWILNYKKYDPEYDPAKWESVFRDNILNVTDGEITGYLNSITGDKLNLEDMESIMKDGSPEYRQLYFFINFDNKKFVNGFYDIEVEEYLPDQNWDGESGNPIDYLPNELKRVVER
jgi:hypothetical protein